MRASGRAGVLSVACVLASAVPALAAFHFAVIDEVMSGLNGDPTAQYVEIKTLLIGQKYVQNTRLTAFNCDGSSATVLLLVPGNICNGMSGARWSMGTASWAAATGVTPDFIFPAGILSPCGMVCWGAPVGPGFFPVDPGTWDPTQLQPGGMPNYVDCVGYGGYTGPLLSTSLPVAASGPGDGTQSLQRGTNTFALAARTPTNNGCSSVTSTTTPGGSGTTSTTMPGSTAPVGPALSGGAPAKTDCYGEWRVAGATGTSHVVRCTDGTSCDVGSGPGCVFRAQLCFDDAANVLYHGKCSASPITSISVTDPGKDATDSANASAVSAALAGLGGQVSGGGVTFTSPVSSSTCTSSFELSVPLKTKGAKMRKGVRTMKLTTTAAKRDSDTLKLICNP